MRFGRLSFIFRKKRLTKACEKFRDMSLVNNNLSRPYDDPRAFDTTDGSPDRQHRARGAADADAPRAGLGARGRLARTGVEYGRFHCAGGCCVICGV